MKYVTILISLVFLFGFIAVSQETSTEVATPAMTVKGVPERTITSPNASVPNKISYQGILTSSGGAPVADGAYDIKFELFNVVSGGTGLWSETQTAVPVSNGTFSVLLGSVTPLIGIFYQPLWVEITVVSGPGIGSPIVFSPRTELASAAYALGPWYSAASNIWVTDLKKVGINTTNPLYSLDVVNIGSPTVAKFGQSDPIYLIQNNPHVGFNIYYDMGFRYGSTNNGGATIAYDQDVNNGLTFNTAPDGNQNDFATLSTRMTIMEDGKVGIGTTSPDKLLDVAGSSQIEDTLFIGTAASTGALKMYRSGVTQPVVSANSSIYGGQVQLFDELGNMVVDIRPNGYGTGGGIDLYRSPLETGVEIWGNAYGDGQGYIRVRGTNRSMIFDPRLVANSSVQLPDSSISAAEMFNEPGVAVEFGRYNFLMASGTDNQRVDSVTINVPSAGKVIVEANGYVILSHTNGISDNIGLHVLTNPYDNVYVNGCSRIFLPASLPTSTDYNYNFGCRNIFSVASATSLKIYLIAMRFAGATTAYVMNSGIFATFYPTTYGNTPVILSNVPQSGVDAGSSESSNMIDIIYQTPEEFNAQAGMELKSQNPEETNYKTLSGSDQKKPDINDDQR